ncbi:MAG: TM1812 family CRISPR-associated protein [Treponemataceae bacterium]
MKIIFVTIPMAEKLSALQYPVDGNISIEYDKKVYFPINGVLAKTLKKNDEVKVVCLQNKEGASSKNAEIFQDELLAINKNIGAIINFEHIIEAFEETKHTNENRYKKLLATFEDNCNIIADITYGQKTLPLVMFAAFNFAQKFFDADIKNIIYGKVEFEKGVIKEGTQKIFDVTPLFSLTALTYATEAPCSDDAVKIMNNFFSS